MSTNNQDLVNRSLELITLLRPKQWIKNAFVVAPLIFSGKLGDPNSFKSTLYAAAIFSIASSATYILNDINDVEKDKLHPKKSKSRPLASGKITIPAAYSLLAILYIILIINFFYIPHVMAIVFAYLVLNIAYSYILKHEPVIDIFTIAIGFVLRVYAGATSINVPLSTWMSITTLCLALYLGSIKRRQELAQVGTDGRKVLHQYSIKLIDRYAEMSATGAILFYSMFVLESKPSLAITIPLVLFGLYRYWYVVEEYDGGESPTDALIADWQLLLTVLIWIATCGYLITFII